MDLFRRFRARRAAPEEPLRCACGAPLDPENLDYGFELPDEVFALAPEEQDARIRGRRRAFVLDGERGFVRTLLPVRLDRGSVTFGVWLETVARDAAVAIEVWELPAYLDLAVDGVVANDLEPFGFALTGARAQARPRSQDELPRVVDGDAGLRDLLARTWSRDALSASIPALAHAH